MACTFEFVAITPETYFCQLKPHILELLQLYPAVTYAVKKLTELLHHLARQRYFTMLRQ